MTTSTTNHETETVHDLSRAESLDLLGRSHVGRLAFADRVGVFPVVVPMTYVVQGSALVLRSCSGGALAGASVGAGVTFEVDRTDDRGRTTWSVLARGMVSEVAHAAGLTDLEGRDLHPHDLVRRHHVLRVEVGLVDGWRTGDGAAPEARQDHPSSAGARGPDGGAAGGRSLFRKQPPLAD